MKTHSLRARRRLAVFLFACLLATGAGLPAPSVAAQQTKPEEKPAEKPDAKQGEPKPTEPKQGELSVDPSRYRWDRRSRIETTCSACFRWRELIRSITAEISIEASSSANRASPSRCQPIKYASR